MTNTRITFHHVPRMMALVVLYLFSTVITYGTETPQGLWEIRGYNRILQIDQTNWKIFARTSVSCVVIEGGSTENLPFIMPIDISPENIFLQAGITRYQANSIEKLPLLCEGQGLKPSLDAVVNFESFWAFFNENYAFFSERNINWQAAYDAARPQISKATTSAELWAILANMVEEFGDGHVTLTDPTQDPPITAEGVQGRALQTFLERQVDEFGGAEGFVKRYFALKKNIQTHLSQKRLKNFWQDGNSRFYGGEIAPEVGYINISYMFGFSAETKDGQDFYADQRALKEVLGRLMQHIKGYRALVIDVRMNPGGYDAFSIELASHFTDKKRLAFSKKARDGESYTPSQNIYVAPAEEGEIFQNPVYLLTSDWTGSATEIFTLAMRVLPNVTVLGTPTAGGLSDSHHFMLPNGWVVTSSNEKYTAADGEIYEGRGIPPDIKQESFQEGHLLKSYMAVIDRALAGL